MAQRGGRGVNITLTETVSEVEVRDGNIVITSTKGYKFSIPATKVAKKNQSRLGKKVTVSIVIGKNDAPMLGEQPVTAKKIEIVEVGTSSRVPTREGK